MAPGNLVMCRRQLRQLCFIPDMLSTEGFPTKATLAMSGGLNAFFGLLGFGSGTRMNSA